MKIQELKNGKCYHCKKVDFYIKVINSDEVIEACNVAWLSIAKKPKHLFNYFEFEEVEKSVFNEIKNEVLTKIK
jgi:hypothetical protein